MDKASNTSYLASQDSVMALHDAAVAAAISVALERKGDRHGPTRAALRAEVERLAAQAAPTPSETGHGAWHDLNSAADAVLMVGKAGDWDAIYCDRLAKWLRDLATTSTQPSQAPVVQAEEYPPLPDSLLRLDGPIWPLICEWDGMTHGLEAGRVAQKIDAAILDAMRAYVDADRASRGVLPAAALTTEQITAGLAAANMAESTFDFGDGSTAAERESAAAIAFREGAQISPVPAPAVRMLTDAEAAEVHEAYNNIDEAEGNLLDIGIAKFCAVNAGRTIPPSGEIGGV